MRAPLTVGPEDTAQIPDLVGEYRRRQPEQSVLYTVIRTNYRSFLSSCEEEDRSLPVFVRREFEKSLVSARAVWGVG